MPQPLPARAARLTVLAAMLAVPALAVAVAATPAYAATASAAATAHYTLSVTGNGTKALVYWSAASQDGGDVGTPDDAPITTLPWKRAVTAKADLYQVVAIQQKGTKLSCTIRNSHGTVVSRATSLGRNAVVTCTLSKRDLFSLSALG